VLRRVPPDEACGGATGFSPWGSTLNSISKCLSRSFFASLTVLVACLMIFSAVVQGGYDVETVLRKPLAIVQFTVDWYRREKRVIRQNEVLYGYL